MLKKDDVLYLMVPYSDSDGNILYQYQESHVTNIKECGQGSKIYGYNLRIKFSDLNIGKRRRYCPFLMYGRSEGTDVMYDDTCRNLEYGMIFFSTDRQKLRDAFIKMVKEEISRKESAVSAMNDSIGRLHDIIDSYIKNDCNTPA